MCLCSNYCWWLTLQNATERIVMELCETLANETRRQRLAKEGRGRYCDRKELDGWNFKRNFRCVALCSLNKLICFFIKIVFSYINGHMSEEYNKFHTKFLRLCYETPINTFCIGTFSKLSVIFHKKLYISMVVNAYRGDKILTLQLVL